MKRARRSPPPPSRWLSSAPRCLPSIAHQLALLLVMILFALTWDILGGQMGYNSFGNVVFFGVGMYACVIVQRDSGLGYYRGLFAGSAAGAALAVAVAALLGSGMLGLRGHYFAIGTLGLGVAAGELASGWDFVGAGGGMVPPLFPARLGSRETFFYYACLLLAAVTLLVLRWLYAGRFGLVLNAIRDDEDKAEAMGLRTTRYKTVAWCVVRLLPRPRRRRRRQPARLHRPARGRLRRLHVRRVDGADGHPGRKGDALGPGDRCRRLPRHPGAVLDVPPRLAARGPRPAHRRHRGLLSGGHPRLGARALAGALGHRVEPAAQEASP